MDKRIRSYRDLNVYSNAFAAALELFELSKNFPPEERYSMVSQIRRSSRSVCANLGEAWRKRRYPAAFVAKLNDAAGEATETQIWIALAKDCGYLDYSLVARLDDVYDHIGAQLALMSEYPDQWVLS
jgi:four helix bundle protein